MHWATHYIGRPWHAGARGPEAFDCWGLFLAIQRGHFGRDLPEIPVNANDLRTVMTTFRDHPERQRKMFLKAEHAHQRLLLVVQGLKKLFADEHFVNLLRAEGLDTLPKYLPERIDNLNGAIA